MLPPSYAFFEHLMLTIRSLFIVIFLHSVSNDKHRSERTPNQIAGDLTLILDLHTVLRDTPGALSRAPAEYFAHVMSAAESRGIGFVCTVMHTALRAHLPPEDRSAVFVEFLKILERLSLNFADDIAAWKEKLEGEGRTNPLLQPQFFAFVKYVQSTSTKNVRAASRVNRPEL